MNLFQRHRRDIFVLGEKRLEQLESEGRYSCYRTTRAVLRKLRKFKNDKPLPAYEVTSGFIKNFQSFLANECGNSHNTIVENIKVVQQLLHDSGISKNLCGELGISREYTRRSYISEEDLSRLMALRLNDGGSESAARDIFFVECRTGLRISDLLLLKWDSYDGSFIRLKMKKTRQEIEIPVTGSVALILDKYRTLFSKSGDRVFPFLDDTFDATEGFDLSKKLVYATTRVNILIKKLGRRAGLGQNLSTHVGRHTFATILLNKGVSIYDIKELLGHSDVKTTQLYAHLMNERKREIMQLLE